MHVVRGLRNASLTVRPVGPSDSAAVDHNTTVTPTPVYLPEGQSLLFGGKDPNRLAGFMCSTFRGIAIFSCISDYQIDVSFSCVCLVIDDEFHHNIIKVVVDPRGDNRVDPRTTLTMVGRNSLSITGQTH